MADRPTDAGLQDDRRLPPRQRAGDPAACAQFVVLCRQFNLFTRTIVAIDGSKFKAVNNRDKNFTVAKVAKRIEQVEASIARYLAVLDRADREDGDMAEAKTIRLKEKIEGLQRQMQSLREIGKQVEAAPDKQVSLTDPDARSMATSGKGTGIVGYNVQIAVDAEHHRVGFSTREGCAVADLVERRAEVVDRVENDARPSFGQRPVLWNLIFMSSFSEAPYPSRRHARTKAPRRRTSATTLSRVADVMLWRARGAGAGCRTSGGPFNASPSSASPPLSAVSKRRMTSLWLPPGLRMALMRPTTTASTSVKHSCRPRRIGHRAAPLGRRRGDGVIGLISRRDANHRQALDPG